jgi:hypothetical protein
MSHEAHQPPAAAGDGAGRHRLTPKDVAAATPIGVAMKVGVARHKAQAAEGAGKAPGTANLMTAILVAGVMIGMLAVMLVFGR